MFKVYDGYRVVIPEQVWEEYRDNPFGMDPRKLHNFQQIAWSYVNQFDNEAFRFTLEHIHFFDNLKGNIHLYGKLSRGTAAQYLQLVTVLGTYRIIAGWVSNDLWYDPMRVVLSSEGSMEDIDRTSISNSSDSLPSLIEISSSERRTPEMEIDPPEHKEDSSNQVHGRIRTLRQRFTQSDIDLRKNIQEAVSSSIIPDKRRLPFRKTRRN